MVQRQCPKCKALFNQKCHYDYHINRKYDCNPNKTNIDDLNDNIILCQNVLNNAVLMPKYAENSICNIEQNKIELRQGNLNIDKEIEIKCCYCDKNFSSKSTLTRHQKVNCKIKKESDNEKEKIFKLLLEKDKQHKEELKLHKEEVSELKKQNKILMDKINNFIPKNNEIIKMHKTIKKLETTIPANTNLTISNQYLEKILEKDKEIEQIITQKNKEKEDKFIIIKNNTKKNIDLYDYNLYDIMEEIEEKQEQIVKKLEEKPMTLILDNNIIECRKSDGYINATQLCSAGNKHFNDWFRLKSTKEYLVSMETKTGIPVLDLINKNIGGEHLGTWIHPKVAINLAQWLSPEFAVQVSNWIYDLMTKGKVETNIRLLKEKDNEIKDKEKRIKHLEQKILKKIPIPKYDDSKFVVYLATNEHSEKKRKYTIGLAINLSKRISSYNKLEDHYPIYYKSFKDEEQMIVAEKMVLNKLNDYRMLESKDRFMLPLGKDIKLFTKVIDDTHNFFQ